MEFGSSFNEDLEQMSTKVPLNSYSPSTSSPSSSSSHQMSKGKGALQIYDKQQLGSWLGTKFQPEEEDNYVGAATKLELMAVDVDEEEEEEDGGDSVVEIEKEHMFDKVVTPSDVGKLNRLVIPKQHAEKYFPLDSSTNEKGLLLNFEDKNGKEWRFRYSYWNSSQSYVMTKGWSRFVKEKKLDAGDIVSFQRGVGRDHNHRLYIDWRRRPDAPPDPTSRHHYLHHHHHHFSSSVPWSPLLMRPPPAAVPLLSRDHIHLSNPNRDAYYNTTSGASTYDFGYGGNYSNVITTPCCSSSPPPLPGSSVYFMRAETTATPGPQQLGMVQWQQATTGEVVLDPTRMVYESVPVVQGNTAAKRLRLFGVNMDCPITTTADESEKLYPRQPHSTAIPLQPALPPPHLHHHHQISQSHQIPIRLRLYNGMPVPAAAMSSLHKDKPSTSLNFDI